MKRPDQTYSVTLTIAICKGALALFSPPTKLSDPKTGFINVQKAKIGRVNFSWSICWPLKLFLGYIFGGCPPEYEGSLKKIKLFTSTLDKFCILLGIKWAKNWNPTSYSFGSLGGKKLLVL
jgi:hypothetical protein